ncbi:hypothetical protein [Actinomyces sp. MRS3W]|uniref:hypothetical protein n=1 Tax=Actinomyces sp. MRS3W TaxID=2800796 RepID=UPI0028FD142C|nr:hypothetical protein [Actinomyces sp. MRS3W]MDU0348455.1 hypothetical protein [Actinomyces sp. MRS3W]MDU0348456.1 hypothetical protein [Actinomyces sp. MRS3W]
MFETGIVGDRSAQAGAVGSPVTPAGTAQLTGDAPLTGQERMDIEDEAAARLSAMVPGAELAQLVEELLAGLLTPATEAGTEGDATAALFNGVTDPGEQALLEAAASHTLVTEPAATGLAVEPAAGDGGKDAMALAASLGAVVLSELVAATGRLAAWAQWAHALTAALLARTPEMSTYPDSWGPDGRAAHRLPAEHARFNTACEIACRLGLTRTGASRLLDRGQALLDPALAPTERLHRVGLLDQSKTALIARRLNDAEPPVARAVQERVLPRASHRTTAQLARDLDKALAALDPDGSSTRRRHNAASRHVTRPREAGEGVHSMRLVMPTMDAFLLDATLDTIAASARATGDMRSTGQLRADALVAMSLHTLRTGQQQAFKQNHPHTSPAPHASKSPPAGSCSRAGQGSCVGGSV